MSDANNSSLPLLFGITATVVLVVGGGWFWLEYNDSIEITASAPPARPAATAAEPAPPVEATTQAAEPVEEAMTDLDTELRKARLAADAELLAFPEGQSALHYYGRALAMEPDHPDARAELYVVLDRLGRQVSGQLEAREYDAAWQVAELVAALEPQHSLVVETRSAIDLRAEELLERALERAREGNDSSAEDALSAAAALPGSQTITPTREAIADIRAARQAADQQRAERNRQAAAARAAAIQRIEDAISDRRLVLPAGDSARDYLEDANLPRAERDRLTGEILEELYRSTLYSIDMDEFDSAEAKLAGTIQLGGDDEKISELRLELEDAYIRAEERKVRTMQQLVQTETALPTYPTRAAERGIEGWVELMFTITPSGQTMEIEVIESNPGTLFERSAREAVSKWRFEPLEFRGRTISQRGIARLVYRPQ